MRNDSLQFRCEPVHLRVESVDSAFTKLCARGDVLRVPISHGEGSYYADEATLDELESSGRVVFRYCTPGGAITPAANPNGSLRNIAGIMNAGGNVVGMMPHPERAGEALMGGTDGLVLWRSVIETGVAAVAH
jgi:phosphoribosylformylglycinamidine synthase